MHALSEHQLDGCWHQRNLFTISMVTLLEGENLTVDKGRAQRRQDHILSNGLRNEMATKLMTLRTAQSKKASL